MERGATGAATSESLSSSKSSSESDRTATFFAGARFGAAAFFAGAGFVATSSTAALMDDMLNALAAGLEPVPRKAMEEVLKKFARPTKDEV